MKNPKYTRPRVPNYVMLITKQNPKKPTVLDKAAKPLVRRPVKKLTMVPVGVKTVPKIPKRVIMGVVPVVVLPVAKKGKVPLTSFEATLSKFVVPIKYLPAQPVWRSGRA